MADWKVSAERIEMFAHPNADRMEVAKVGMFQLVVAKDNNYRTGDLVVFAPKRSILPLEIRDNYRNADTGLSYLRGGERVSSVRLRGELSEGVTVSKEWALSKLGGSELVEGEDISEQLGITEYVPPVPMEFAGKVEPLNLGAFARHDVESSLIYGSEFEEGEPVLITEKLHGTQINMVFYANGQTQITSKGFAGKHMALLESAGNIYWQALHNSGVAERVRQLFPNSVVQAMGEVVPAQGANWSYGFAQPTVRLFRLHVDGERLNIANPRVASLRDVWAPVLHSGPYTQAEVSKLAVGKETVSGKSLHIREGVVIEPMTPRNAREGFALYLKVINPKFKDDDDSVS